MRSRLLVTVSAAALIAGAGLVNAQDKGPAAAPQTTSPAQQSTTPSQSGGGGAPAGEMQQRQEAPPARAQQDMNRGDQKQQRAQERREQRQDRAQDKSSPKGDRNATDTKSDRKGGATTGQGAAGSGNASLTSEQRSKITTNIRRTNVKRETNVNFNIAVGTAIPRTVTLHALPPTVVEVYPQWRGYRFVLVEDEIIIIEPGSYRIVAVIDA
jgi:type IV secretory pathway VirB10-like protein